jgi:hypothetical protein
VARLAAAKGRIPFKNVKSNPVASGVTGGIAVFVIVLMLGSHLYAKDECGGSGGMAGTGGSAEAGDTGGSAEVRASCGGWQRPDIPLRIRSEFVQAHRIPFVPERGVRDSFTVSFRFSADNKLPVPLGRQRTLVARNGSAVLHQIVSADPLVVRPGEAVEVVWDVLVEVDKLDKIKGGMVELLIPYDEIRGCGQNETIVRLEASKLTYSVQGKTPTASFGQQNSVRTAGRTPTPSHSSDAEDSASRRSIRPPVPEGSSPAAPGSRTAICAEAEAIPSLGKPTREENAACQRNIQQGAKTWSIDYQPEVQTLEYQYPKRTRLLMCRCVRSL